MSGEQLNDNRIISSWMKNVRPWTRSIREHSIESRKLITNDAIIQAIRDYHPRSVLDIGCGEGWLVRELYSQNIKAIGIDAIAEFIDVAKQTGEGDYYLLSYEELASGKFQYKTDLWVCNFSLLGEAAVENIFAIAPTLLHQQGKLIVQTLHPCFACGELPYQDGWREGSWAGFEDDFIDPAPWYFRTVQSWIKLFTEHGLRLREIREPLHPATSRPASIIFIGEVL